MNDNNENRAGRFVEQSIGYKSFIPIRLVPPPNIKYDNELWKLLSDADRKLGRLDGITQILPNPDLFVAMYVQKEAVLSAQIEGTQASLTDVLNIESHKNKWEEVEEVICYISAMNYGLDRLDEFPLCLRLLREIHEKLLEKGRGCFSNPGEFRKTQNWIGPSGCTLRNAVFIPPVIADMNEALTDLEKFFYEEIDMPSLIKIAIIHAQFETIHPFLDGNGRMGRLLITFWLCLEEILTKPLLYLSYYFKSNRIEYYDRLMEVRKKGDWEGWIKYFLRGVAFVSDEAIESAKSIIALKDKFNEKLKTYNNANYTRLFEQLFSKPFVTKTDVSNMLGIAYPTASSIVDQFIKEGILTDTTPFHKRNKQFCFAEYLEILNRGTEV